MSFCTQTKNELSRIELKSIYAKEAELYAYIQNTGTLSLKGRGKISLFLETEEAFIARRIYKLIKDVFNITTEIAIKKNPIGKKSASYCISISESEQCSIILDYFNIIDFSLNPLKIKDDIFSVIRDKENIKDYLRGVFLSCGYISDPNKTYQMEFVVKDEKYAQILIDLSREFEVNLKLSKRKEKFIVYTKDSENMLDFLGLIGAHSSVLKIENTKVIKEVRNNANRRTNCDTANMDKTLISSERHIKAIKKIKALGAFDGLSENLKTISTLRINYPEASLKELGEMLSPPVSKSVVNNRLRRIEKISEKI